MPIKFNDDNFIITETQYNSGVSVNLWNGIFSIVAAKKNQKGDIWSNEAFPAKWGGDGKFVPGANKFPTSVGIGTSKDDAISTLETLIDMVRAMPDESVGEEKDVPF